jgi:hypothetical protein
MIVLVSAGLPLSVCNQVGACPHGAARRLIGSMSANLIGTRFNDEATRCRAEMKRSRDA